MRSASVMRIKNLVF